MVCFETGGGENNVDKESHKNIEALMATFLWSHIVARRWPARRRSHLSLRQVYVLAYSHFQLVDAWTHRGRLCLLAHQARNRYACIRVCTSLEHQRVVMNFLTYRRPCHPTRMLRGAADAFPSNPLRNKYYGSSSR